MGQIKYIYESSFNAGTLVTSGADLNLRYRLPETSFGNFTANFQTTYIQKYDITTSGETQGFAGHFDRTYGNLVRWRALAGLDWNWGAFNASWTARYVGRGRIVRHRKSERSKNKRTYRSSASQKRRKESDTKT